MFVGSEIFRLDTDMTKHYPKLQIISTLYDSLKDD